MSLPSLVSYGPDSDEEASPNSSHVNEHAMEVDKIEDAAPIDDKNRKASELWDDDVMFAEANEEHQESPRGNSQASSAYVQSSEAPPPPPRGGDTNVSSDDDDITDHSKNNAKTFVGNDEDDFDRVNREAKEQALAEKREKGDMSTQSSRHTSPGSVIPEPKPPGRIVQEEETPSDEERIDQIIAEGEKTIKEAREMLAGDNSGTNTPLTNSPARYPSPSEQDLEYMQGPDRLDGPVTIPSDCEEEVDQVLISRFVQYFERKARGMDMNDEIQNKKIYKNPSSYQDFIDRFDIDELGTNFSKNLFDPHGFLGDCYYDALHAQQTKLMDRESQKSKTKPAK